jgi:uroporphyrinogen decarboxylase
LNTLRRKGDPDRVPFLELYADQEIISEFLGEPIPFAYGQAATHEQLGLHETQKIRFWHALGYDAIWTSPILAFPGLTLQGSEDTAGTERGQRLWMPEKTNLIGSWEEFEAYPWPRLADVDFFRLEHNGKHLPDGMGMLASCKGVFESVSFLMGYEQLALALYEQPDLVAAMFARIRDLLVGVVETVTQMPGVVGFWIGDDMGFKTGTLIAPKHLRRYALPIHKELAAIAHRRGMPYLLHSCGNLRAIMDDLIDDVGIDGKHSFEDVIQPVEQFFDEYGPRISVIGGLDINLLASGSEDEVRARTRRLLAHCGGSGAYVLGSGNSIANYVPLRNFLAMVEEGQRYNGAWA